MRIGTNRLIKSLLGIILLCVFMIRPCAAFVRDVSTLKNLAAIEKGIDDTSKENKESKEDKGRFYPEFVVPALETGSGFQHGPVSLRRLILQEFQGCSGPILLIHTPPPDAGCTF